ncbi:MAG: bifunctional metallophosphatase/5'-nucleotidase [Nevskia sp.]
MKVLTWPACRWRLLSTLLMLAGLVSCTAAPVSPAISLPASGTPVTIKLIAINDFHGHLRPPKILTELPGPEKDETVSVPLGGAAYVATEVKALEARNPNHVMVGAGDLYSASPLESALFHDESTIAALNAIGLEFSSVGNHEFDRGRDDLLRMQNGGCAPDGSVGNDTCMDEGRYGGAKFRYLAANVIDEASGRPLLPAYGLREIETAAGKVRIAFIGLVVRSAPDLVPRSGIPGLRFDDEADTVNALLPEIEAQGIHSIVVLIHEGGKSTGRYNDHACPGFSGRIIDIVHRLAPAVAAVISAHTHQPYVCRLESRDPAHRILVTSAGSYGRFVTDIDLAIDPARDEVVGAEANNIAVVNDAAPNPAPGLYPALAADPALAALVARYTRLAAPVADRVVGRVGAELGNRADSAGESPLGLVIADAQLEATRGKRDGAAQIAFMNIGGLRSSLQPVDPDAGVSYGQVYTAQPFGTHLTTLTLSGAQIHALLEAQWHADGTDAILQPSSGFTYAWRASAPVGAKIDPASIRLDGRPLRPEHRYRVTVNNFLADGGDAFRIFTEGGDRREFLQLDRDILIGYLQRHSPLAPPKPGRIRRLD